MSTGKTVGKLGHMFEQWTEHSLLCWVSKHARWFWKVFFTCNDREDIKVQNENSKKVVSVLLDILAHQYIWLLPAQINFYKVKKKWLFDGITFFLCDSQSTSLLSFEREGKLSYAPLNHFKPLTLRVTSI